jgi:hypothetical protein
MHQHEPVALTHGDSSHPIVEPAVSFLNADHFPDNVLIELAEWPGKFV